MDRGGHVNGSLPGGQLCQHGVGGHGGGARDVRGYTALFADGYNWLEITLKSRFTCTFAFIALSSELFKNQDHTDTTDCVFVLVLPSPYKVVSDWLDPLNSSPVGQLHGCILLLLVVCLG